MTGKHRAERLANDAAGIARAAELLRAGGLVGVPTETVYGLAARSDHDDAVARIYRAKGRPDFNPLIVHVGSLEQALCMAQFDATAEALAAAFWPGPLTLVLPLASGARIAAAVAAGLPTVALRMPDHPTMLTLLRKMPAPLAAPSANPSGQVSPTSAEHVLQSLGARIDAVLDAGETQRGVESTIVAVRPGGGWQLLRPGPVTVERLRAQLGPQAEAGEGRIEAPGQLASHYSPGKPIRLGALTATANEFMIGFGPVAGDCTLAADGDLAGAAARLYACLHQAAASALPRIAVAPVPETDIGAAINDRLRRAAA